MTATADDVKYWHDTGKAMLADGLSVPVPLEHQPGIGAMTAAEKAATNLVNNAGWVEDYQIRKDKLYSLVNVPDDKLASKLPSTIKFTSPWFNSFTDGNGKKWDGVISHLALTNRPRIPNQEPFKPEEIALSLTNPVMVVPTKEHTPKLGLCLSKAGLLVKGKPVFKGAFSVWSGEKKVDIKLDLAPPKEGKKPPPKEEKPAEGKKPKEGEEELEEGLESEEYDDEYENVDVLRDLMSIYGVEMGECDETNVIDCLVKACLAKLKAEHGQEEPPPEANPNTPKPPGGPIVQESPPMFMSLEAIEKIADPVQKQILKRDFHRNKRELDKAKADLDVRVERLAKRVPANVRDSLLAQAKDVKLSLDEETGAVVNPMNVMLDMMEKAIPDMPSLLTANPATIMLQQHPEEFSGSISDERAERIADGLLGVKPKV